MLSAKQVIDSYFLEARSMLVELAATLDRYDAACGREGVEPAGADLRLDRIYRSLAILADRSAGPNRAERLLGLFSDPAD